MRMHNSHPSFRSRGHKNKIHLRISGIWVSSASLRMESTVPDTRKPFCFHPWHRGSPDSTPGLKYPKVPPAFLPGLLPFSARREKFSSKPPENHRVPLWLQTPMYTDRSDAQILHFQEWWSLHTLSEKPHKLYEKSYPPFPPALSDTCWTPGRKMSRFWPEDLWPYHQASPALHGWAVFSLPDLCTAGGIISGEYPQSHMFHPRFRHRCSVTAGVQKQKYPVLSDSKPLPFSSHASSLPHPPYRGIQPAPGFRPGTRTPTAESPGWTQYGEDSLKTPLRSLPPDKQNTPLRGPSKIFLPRRPDESSLCSAFPYRLLWSRYSILFPAHKARSLSQAGLHLQTSCSLP